MPSWVVGEKTCSNLAVADNIALETRAVVGVSALVADIKLAANA